MTKQPDHDELIALAREQAVLAYAPYSRFKTGAAVATADGSTVVGSLVENVSLGLSMCAERVALFAAVASGTTPTRLALAAPDTDGELTWPCGACVQVALELGGGGMTIIVGDDDGGPVDVATVADLLPRGPKVHHD